MCIDPCRSARVGVAKRTRTPIESATREPKDEAKLTEVRVISCSDNSLWPVHLHRAPANKPGVTGTSSPWPVGVLTHSSWPRPAGAHQQRSLPADVQGALDAAARSSLAPRILLRDHVIRQAGPVTCSGAEPGSQLAPTSLQLTVKRVHDALITRTPHSRLVSSTQGSRCDLTPCPVLVLRTASFFQGQDSELDVTRDYSS